MNAELMAVGLAEIRDALEKLETIASATPEGGLADYAIALGKLQGQALIACARIRTRLEVYVDPQIAVGIAQAA